MATKTVTTFAELKAAVQDADTVEIILDADITFSGGIGIPATKKVLTIDGGGHTVTDNVSSAYTDALYAPAGMGEATITVKNAVWSGRNYYGIICVVDATTNAGVTTILSNLTYKGPQAVYNRYGTTVVENCNITLQKNGASAAPQEFAEANRLIFKGTVEIVSESTSNALIWFPFANSAFTVEANAVLTMSVPNAYAFYTDSAAKPVFTFGENSSTRFSVKNGLFYSSGTGAHIASSFTLKKGALFYASSSANNGVPLFKCAGNFTVGEDSSLFLVMPTGGSSPLIYLSTASVVSFESPKNVVLYANGGKVFSFASGSAGSPNTVSLSAKQINCWLTAKTPYESAGGFADISSSIFFRQDGTNAEITQKLSSSAAISTESNLTSGDEGYPVSVSNFDLTKYSVLSMGNLKLTVNAITDLSTEISGKTDGGAAVEYSDSEQSASGNAANDGDFSLPISVKPIVGDIATIRSNKNFLTTHATATVTGSVSITDLPDVPFNAFVAPRRTAKVARINGNLRIELTDTRTNGGKWYLYATLKSELQSNTESIADAVVFTDETSTVALNSSALLVASGVTEKAGIIEVIWTPDQGILLDLSPEKEYAKGNYSSTLEWSIIFE